MVVWYVHMRVSFFFNDTATTEIYTLSLHDALPICHPSRVSHPLHLVYIRRPRRVDGFRDLVQHAAPRAGRGRPARKGDRKSTRLNSSHANISYAVFCLKKKRNTGLTSCSDYNTHRM